MEPQWDPTRHQNLTKCMPDPFQKQIPNRTPHQKGPNPETAYSCTLWHDFQGPQAPQMPTKTPPKINPNSKTCYKKRTRKTHGNTCCKMMLPASESMPKGSPFLSLGLSFHVISRLGAPPAALLAPEMAQTHKSRPKSLKNTPGTC